MTTIIVITDSRKRYIHLGERIEYGDLSDVLFPEVVAEADALRGGIERDMWVVDEDVLAGDKRIFGGHLWECLQGHRTQSDWTPPATPALWKRAFEPDEIPAWFQPAGGHDAWALGAIVTHNDATWKSRRDNNTWEPGTSDSGWLRTEPYPSAWYYLGGEGYPLDWQVTHKGSTWRNTSAGNTYEPGVWGWTKL